MNILMIGPDSTEKGGIATVISNFKQYYNHKDYKLSFLSSWSKEKKWSTQFKAFFLLRQKINQENIDIVHFHVAQKGSFFRKAFLRKLIPKRCKVIFHMHASQFDVFYKKSDWFTRLWIRKILNSIDSIVALSQSWADFYNDITDIPVIVIQNAVYIPEKILYNADSKKIVTFGKVGERKGSYDLLKVAKAVEKKFPEIQFILYGDGETEKIAKQIEIEKIKNVSLGGWINQNKKEAILKNMALHFLPSYHEGLPMAILETMAAGIPNLSTKVGGISEVINQNQNGILTDAGDIDEMVKQLIDFFELEFRREKFSLKARKKIETEFSIENYHRKWNDLYEKVLE